MFASCPIASMIRRQTATPASSPSAASLSVRLGRKVATRSLNSANSVIRGVPGLALATRRESEPLLRSVTVTRSCANVSGHCQPIQGRTIGRHVK